MSHRGFGQSDWRRLAAASLVSVPKVSGEDGAATIASMNVLGIPYAIDKSVLPCGTVGLEREVLPDVVVLTEPRSASLLNSRLSSGFAAVVPVVDAARTTVWSPSEPRADASIGALSKPMLAEALAALAPCVERLRALPESVFESDDPRLWLLARLHVRNRVLGPRRDPCSRLTVVFDDEAAVPGSVSHADDLTILGLMERRFCDVLRVCPHCQSARLSVHEYCAACGSADLREQPILHHMKCAFQGPEAEFRSAEGLSCPKCRKPLRQFSVDYDRPGSICICGACGHASTEPTIGFVCLDCSASVKVGDVESHVVHSYALTEAGHLCVLGGAPLPRSAPDCAERKLRDFLVRHKRDGGPWCVLRIGLCPPPGIPASGRTWKQTCDFFSIVMREAFTDDTGIVEAPPVYLALIEGDRREEVEGAIPEIRERLLRHLSLSPTIDMAVFGPDTMGSLTKMHG